MPAVLDREKAKVDGLAFMGLSLCRASENGNAQSATHQQAFDFNRLTDRDYRYVQSSDDDGWLGGGGEPETSYKFPAPDSAHIEIMHIGTYTQSLGGLDPVVLAEALKSGEILIPEMAVVPTSVSLNDHKPPDLQIRFDMVPDRPNLDFPVSAPLPMNWQLRFVHNQLFRRFQFPCRYCPDPFHAKMMGKVEFRSKKHEEAYFEKCNGMVNEWLERGQQPLVPPQQGGKDASVKTLRCKKWAPAATTGDDYLDSYYKSGIWLFTDRNTPTHQFMPNFFPPYDTPAKRKIILEVLKDEWDEKTLSWKPLYDPPPMMLPGGGNGQRSADETEEREAAASSATTPVWGTLLRNFNGAVSCCGSLMDPFDDMSEHPVKTSRQRHPKNSTRTAKVSPVTDDDDEEEMREESEMHPVSSGLPIPSQITTPSKNKSMRRTASEVPRPKVAMAENPELEDTASF